jgi:hypothetical protein
MANGNIDWRVWGAVIGALITGFGSGTVSRIDPWTGADAKNQEQRIMLEIQKRHIELKEELANLKREQLAVLGNLPPEATQDRIRGIERKLWEEYRYIPPTQKWR